MRCSTDYHNVLIQQAPVSYVLHTSWQVEDIDEIGRGATKMLRKDPGRHVWGLEKHFVGSNYFWYLKDPAGNFSEYYSDIECIVDDQLWTRECGRAITACTSGVRRRRRPSWHRRISPG